MKGTPDSAVDARRFALGTLIAYVLLSWMVRFDMAQGAQVASLVYPFDTFSMYSSVADSDMTHLLVRLADGSVARVPDFRSFDCGAPLAGRPDPCQGGARFRYHYDDLIDYIDARSSPGGEPVALIVRRWEIRSGEAPRALDDCLLAECRAVR